jgi:toxin ParE1/3/4
MKAIIWADQALQDLADIDDWFETIAPDFAKLLGDLAVAAARFVAEHPGVGQMVGDNGERKWTVKGTDYRIFYRAQPAAIEILRIRHGRENWRDD